MARPEKSPLIPNRAILRAGFTPLTYIIVYAILINDITKITAYTMKKT